MHRNSELWTKENRKGRVTGYLAVTLLVLLVITVVVHALVRLQPNDDADTTRGVKQIRSLEKIDASESEASIKALRDQWEQAAADQAAAEQAAAEAAAAEAAAAEAAAENADSTDDDDSEEEYYDDSDESYGDSDDSDADSYDENY